MGRARELLQEISAIVAPVVLRAMMYDTRALQPNPEIISKDMKCGFRVTIRLPNWVNHRWDTRSRGGGCQTGWCQHMNKYRLYFSIREDGEPMLDGRWPVRSVVYAVPGDGPQASP